MKVLFPNSPILGRLLACLVLAAPLLAGCISGKTVYVDNGAMFSKVKAFVAIRDSVNAFNESWKKPAMALKDSIDQYMQKMSALQAPVSDKEREVMEREFRERQERLRTFADANQKKAVELEKSLTDAAVKKTNSLLQEYCEEKKYDMILGTTAGGNILAANRRLDITPEVIRYLDERLK